MRRTLLPAALLLLATVAVAADVPTPLKLSDFKLKPAFEGVSADLYGYNEVEAKLFLYVNGTASGEFDAKEDGDITATVEASGDKGEKELPKFKLTIGGKVIEKEFELKKAAPKEYTFKASVTKGKQKIEIEFLNDSYKEGEYDCNLFLHAVKIGK